MNVGSRIKPDIAEEQFGIAEGNGATNLIYVLKILDEHGAEVPKDLSVFY